MPRQDLRYVSNSLQVFTVKLANPLQRQKESNEPRAIFPGVAWGGQARRCHSSLPVVSSRTTSLHKHFQST